MAAFSEITSERLIVNHPTAKDLESFLHQINSSKGFSKDIFNVTFLFDGNIQKMIGVADVRIEPQQNLRNASPV